MSAPDKEGVNVYRTEARHLRMLDEDEKRVGWDLVRFDTHCARVTALSAERDALRAERDRIAEAYWTLYHAAWHALDDSEDDGTSVAIMRSAFEELAALMPEEEEHPERDAVIARAALEPKR